MDLMTILYVVMLSIGGVALDAYQTPKLTVVEVIAPGSNTTPSLDREFISEIVFGEIDRAAQVRSLITHPKIRSSDDKSIVETIAEALGAGPVVGVLHDLVVSPYSRLKIGLFNENGKPAVLVSGTSKIWRETPYVSISPKPAPVALPVKSSAMALSATPFDNVMYLEENETVIKLIKRSTIEGISQIDPYLAILHMLNEAKRTNDDQYAKEALRIVARVVGQAPGDKPLLARLTNLEGLVHLARRDLEKARTTFLRGIDYVRDRRIMVRAILAMNLAFIEIAQGNPDSAAARLAILLAPDGMLTDDMVFRTFTSDGVPLLLGDAESAFVRSNGIALAGYAALAHNDLNGAQRSGKKALELDPMRLTPHALLADIAERQGNAAEAARLRALTVDLQLGARSYMDTASGVASLSLAGPTPKVNPSLYVLH